VTFENKFQSLVCPKIKLSIVWNNRSSGSL